MIDKVCVLTISDSDGAWNASFHFGFIFRSEKQKRLNCLIWYAKRYHFTHNNVDHMTDDLNSFCSKNNINKNVMLKHHFRYISENDFVVLKEQHLYLNAIKNKKDFQKAAYEIFKKHDKELFKKYPNIIQGL